MIFSRVGTIVFGLMVATPAMAGVTVIDFEDTDIQGQTVGDFYNGLGIKFDGLLFQDIDYGDFNFEEARVRDLRGIWGSDTDSEAVSTGFGISSVTIGFEATASAFNSLVFTVARMMDQEITVIGRDANTGDLYTHTIAGGTSQNDPSRTVEEIVLDLDQIFFGGSSVGAWTEIAVHNHGGFFGLDDISYLPSTPVPGVAPALAGLVGMVGLRRRRR